MKYNFFTKHMHKLLGCIYDMACEAIKNGDKQEAQFCRQVMDLIEIPEEVAKDHKQNTQGGVMALITNTYGRVEITCDWLGQASDEEIAQIQKSQAEFTQWKYYD